MTELAGKVALVTGGSRGIGAAVARRLAADGAAVALTYANGAAQAADVAQSIEDKGGRAVVIHADHADPPAAARAVEQTVDQLRRLDILVNNAASSLAGHWNRPLCRISTGSSPSTSRRSSWPPRRPLGT
jgi:3-oxoacyl-[acyl-carrier protein] reductase